MHHKQRASKVSMTITERTGSAWETRIVYENDDCVAIALKKFTTLKHISSDSYDNCIPSEEDKFEETDAFVVKFGRRTAIALTSVELVAITLQEESSSASRTCSARGISRLFKKPFSEIRNMLWNIIQCHPFEITHIQEFFFCWLGKTWSFRPTCSWSNGSG